MIKNTEVRRNRFLFSFLRRLSDELMQNTYLDKASNLKEKKFCYTETL